MKTATTTVVVGLITLLVVGTAVIVVWKANSSAHESTGLQVTTVHSARIWSVEDLGPAISINQTTNVVGKLTLPAYLPGGLTLQEIRGNDAFVSLVYVSPSLPTLANWNRGSMIIWVGKDSTSYIPAPPYQVGGHEEMQCDPNVIPLQNCTTIERTVSTVTQTVIKNIIVSGHPGHGWDPEGTYGIGTVTWWASGLHYTIAADLPLSTLLEIAQSMNT